MTDAILITGIFSDTVSFAMQQNHIPIVRQLVVKNRSDAELTRLRVTVTTDPALAEIWTAEIASLMPGRERVLDSVDIRISASGLFELTERINGTMTITVSDDTGVLARDVRDLSFLSYDEWSGANTYPEFLAAFITPNHPYTSEIIKKAGSLLEEWMGTPSFTGYQSKNPNNVRKQMAAIYGALSHENIAYCMPPASFEEHGQKIRLSGTIKEQKLATCLDLALLYAGCLEAAGLHPMVAVIKGHAFAGCWLEEDSFAECVQDDVSALTKRTAPGINEICVVETSAFTAGANMDFEAAAASAEGSLRKPEEFLYLIDVKRSRGSGIRPIPQRREDGTFASDSDDASPGGTFVTSAPGELDIIGKLSQADSLEFTRQQMWERKLLDLSLRNSLLSFRVTKSSIQLLVDSLHDLEDALASGEEFQILHKPQDMLNSPRDNKIYEGINNESIWNTLIKSEFQSRRIRTYLSEDALSSAITHLYRTARASMEENGANTLYLAMGFLKWYESGVSEKARYAPLIMIPVDIIRKSAQRGYVFRLRDEEPQFNVTLLEMLRMNFGITVSGLDPLPTDEHGIDIKLIFNIIRRAIMDKPRWDVEELAFMGIFSFSQFIMWNDIRNRVEDLKRNKVVSSLVSGQMEWESDISFPTPEVLDDTVAPLDLAVPISADSSQLAAVYASGQGQSFVLHGPPGTGKSQTITNIIANALYHGKTVLFVAEKMAALTVVEKRLNAIGLGDFCLELHSNKARKKDVLGQLEKALNVGRIKPPQSYKDEADAILALRRELNGVVRELHKPRGFGFSVYDAISAVERHGYCPDCITFTSDQTDSLTPQKYTLWKDLCETLSAVALSCGGIHNHSLREYKNPAYTQTDRSDLEQKLKEYTTTLAGLKEAIAQALETIGLPPASPYHDALLNSPLNSPLSTLNSQLPTLLSGPRAVRTPSTILAYKDLPSWKGRILDACAAGRRRDELKSELGKAFSEQILSFDAGTALLMWKKAEASWFLPKMTGKSKVAKSIRLYALDIKGFNKADTPKYLELVAEYQKNEAAVKELSPLLNQLYGAMYNNGSCDWPLIGRIAEFSADIQGLIKEITGDEAVQDTVIESLSKSLDHNFDRFIQASRPVWDRLSELNKSVAEQEDSLSDKFRNSFGQWHEEPDWIASMSERASRWIANLSELRDYCGYLQVKAKLAAEGLRNVYTALENGDVNEAQLTGAFIKGISKACAMQAIDGTPELSSFHGNLFSQKIEKFKALNRQFESLTKREIAARLSSQIPAIGVGVSGSSEIGILQRAIKSGGRMMPVRKLFESIPNLLRKLSPCMLMSPISVAQYLDPKYPAFDLVVFDEASQLPTSEAVGAIARGNELIVVGDPKQLPPTNFFNSTQIDEDNYEKEDLESVLDDCLALSMPQEHLLWHYRSRHESLIAFSNKTYYENKLYTFPSPNDMVSQVRLVPVEGFYDRGKTKQNKAEAQAIIDEIIRRLSDPVLSKRSIGVVTFSSVQQTLITDMLDAEFSKNPELDEAANNTEEPLFIKNLENVQGDERDVILFSVGYGPDEQGRVALNFGPLNREGGWRRLNVAVTRARYEMLIFSVLRPEQIDLNRTRADGLAGLRAFLEFAARGVSALPYADEKRDSADGTGVVEIIADRLRELGYQAHPNIGCSGYQVDIGIIHPDNPDAYVLGILCDGVNYHNSGTALDRNNTQEAVLRGLGWGISRIWVLDWWDNPEKELRRIQSEVELALSGGHSTTDAQEPAGDIPTEAGSTGDMPVIAGFAGDMPSANMSAANVSAVSADEGSAASESPAAGDSATEAVNGIALGHEEVEQGAQDMALKYYEPAQLPPVKDYLGNSEFFASYKSTAFVRRQIETVLNAEAPIHKDILHKRILGAWGITRTGAKVNARLDELLIATQIKHTKANDAVFYWRTGIEPSQYDDFRLPSPDESSRRSIEHIAPEELACVVKYVLNQQLGLPREDLDREVSKALGFARCTEIIQRHIRVGVDIAVTKGWAVISGGRVTVGN